MTYHDFRILLAWVFTMYAMAVLLSLSIRSMHQAYMNLFYPERVRTIWYRCEWCKKYAPESTVLHRYHIFFCSEWCHTVFTWDGHLDPWGEVKDMRYENH